MKKLQDILDDIAADALPPAWQPHDLAAFSAGKRLWDYQQAALENALKALWLYYEDFADYRAGEAAPANASRKQRMQALYAANGLSADLDIAVNAARRDIHRLLDDYYPISDGRIAYEHFLNRMGFWMATGSGKTLVIVKLIELLWRLTAHGEIPQHDILILTHRDDLIGQLRRHVDEFNAARGDLTILLHDLRAYPDVKRAMPSLLHGQEATVFYYRSDNLSDEQKEKIVDFRNYDNNGQWYVLLDEAHKGDKEDSKRQHIYSILARNGFLFNFSATFTDVRDVATTAYDFNLARFTQQGYGKHISILKQENRAFRDEEDYSGDEKQKVVLKALIMLAYAHKAQAALVRAAGRTDLYHRPLLLTLVNSVNVQEADLKLFFRELARIGRGDIDAATWKQAAAELWAELGAHPELMFEKDRFTADQALFESIRVQDVLAHVFNAPGPGEIEALARPSDRQELAFKLKTADRPFALIKIGDISGWLKNELAGYEITEGFEDEGFFLRLNTGSDINVLMGSRTFYEGWDSPRPNVITYIHIGVGAEARKFILQSIGRGVRIEPLRGKRRRLLALRNARQVDDPLFWKIKDIAPALETLFIFGTNRAALHAVVEQLDLVKGADGEHELSLAVNDAAIQGRALLIPTYQSAQSLLIDQRNPGKVEMSEDDRRLLADYVAYLGDDRLLVARHGATPRQTALLQRVLAQHERYFLDNAGRRCGGVDVALPRLFAYFGLAPERAQGVKPLDDEINHFRHIKVLLQDVSELQRQINQVARYGAAIADLRAKWEARQLSFDQFLQQGRQLQETGCFEHDGTRLDLRRIAQHYYIPLILADTDRVDYIRHIVRHQSEVRFVNDLEAYVVQAGNRFEAFDWWAFSKLDETLDRVYLPYYDSGANRIRQFKPDFIFWLQKGSEYVIAFVDPKGMVIGEHQHKLDGYRQVFLDANAAPARFVHDGLTVRVMLFLYTRDRNQASLPYADFWFDHPAQIAERIGQAIGT